MTYALAALVVLLVAGRVRRALLAHAHRRSVAEQDTFEAAHPIRQAPHHRAAHIAERVRRRAWFLAP